jgi:hypothetical protein
MTPINQAGHLALQLAFEHIIAPLRQEENPFRVHDFDLETGLESWFLDHQSVALCPKSF